MQTVEQRHREAARALADYAGFRFAADHLDMAISATAEAFARFEVEHLARIEAATVDAEREARARIAESYQGTLPPPTIRQVGKDIATAIRARQAASLAPSETAEANIVDRARTLIVTTIRDAARLYAPTASGRGSYEYLAGMATKVEQAEAVKIDSYLALDCVIAAFKAALPPSGIAETWQPIETAPKDEELWFGYFGDNKGWFGHQWKGHAFQWENMSKPLHAGGHIDPTHWRPLPAPPAIRAPKNQPRKEDQCPA